MENQELNTYFSDIFKFLRNKDDNEISSKKVFLYIIFILAIITIGQISVYNSYKSEHEENKRFINNEIKRQIIIDTITLESSFARGGYLSIKLANDLNYPIHLENYDNVKKITINATIEKKANDKIFEIVNDKIKYKYKICDISEIIFPTRMFVLFGTLLFSLGGIFWLNQNEREKENEKNSR